VVCGLDPKAGTHLDRPSSTLDYAAASARFPHAHVGYLAPHQSLVVCSPVVVFAPIGLIQQPRFLYHLRKAGRQMKLTARRIALTARALLFLGAILALATIGTSLYPLYNVVSC